MKLRLFQVIETPMAPLSERARKAQSVAREIQRIGGYVLNSMPLRDDEKELRIQILDTDKHILEEIKTWGWTPVFAGPMPRIHISGSFETACIYRIEIPIERPNIPDNRIHGEISDKKKPPDKERVEMLKSLGYRGYK